MTLQITDDVVYDEQIPLDPLDNDDDVSAFSSGLQAALAGLPSAGEAAELGRQTSRPATFFAAARSVAEDDDLGRFVYASAGLELLVTQVERHSRERLVQRPVWAR